MTDILNLYPKSSCPCETCLPEYSIPQTGYKSNLGVRGCNPSPYFECYNRVETGSQVQPQDKRGWYDLNPQVYLEKIADGFDRVKCSDKCPIPGCQDPAYLSMDPRLFNAPRAEYLPLDRPPMDGNVYLRDVYSDKYEDYGQGYQDYSSIRDGQITYYIDKSIEDAFYKPVFSEPAEETSVLFKDPMGAMKPEYNRKALINNANPTVTTAKNYPYCLSFIQDSQSYREDLMALQQRKNNQEKWSARWAGNNM